jgi:hypothetical protein
MNPGFDSMVSDIWYVTSAWSDSTSTRIEHAYNGINGSYGAGFLGGDVNETGSIGQGNIYVPTDLTRALLSFQLKIRSNALNFAPATDKLYLTITTGSGVTLLNQSLLASELDQNNYSTYKAYPYTTGAGYNLYSLLSKAKGSLVTITFATEQNGVNSTSFRIDDVNLVLTSSPATQRAVVESFAPNTNSAGSYVDIFGYNFSPDPWVYFSGVRSTDVILKSQSHIQARVPSKCGSGPITVLVDAGTTTTSAWFIEK